MLRIYVTVFHFIYGREILLQKLETYLNENCLVFKLILNISQTLSFKHTIRLQTSK